MDEVFNIFQVSSEPIDRDYWAFESDVREYSYPICKIKYLSEISDDDDDEYNERKKVIAKFVETLGDVFTLNPDGQSMTYNGGVQQWKENYIQSLKDSVNALATDNVFIGPKLWRLEHRLKYPEPMGHNLFIIDAACWADDSINFLSWVDCLNVGDTVYFGAVMEYSF